MGGAQDFFSQGHTIGVTINGDNAERQGRKVGVGRGLGIPESQPMKVHVSYNNLPLPNRDHVKIPLATE